MKTITFELPQHFDADLQKYQDRAQEAFLLGIRQLKIQEALYLYSNQLVTIGRAAEMAGVSQQEIIRHAHAAGLKPHYSAEMASEELA